MNEVKLTGRLTKDPELKKAKNGGLYTRFTLAVDRKSNNADTNKTAYFIPITAWGKVAENCAQTLKKGALCYIEGELRTGSYDGSDGKKNYTKDIICLKFSLKDNVLIEQSEMLSTV